jgi:hypothetical protein
MPIRNVNPSWLRTLDFMCCWSAVFQLGLRRHGGQHRFHKHSARSRHWTSGKAHGDWKIPGSRENRFQRNPQTEPDRTKAGRLFCLSLPRRLGLEWLDCTADLRHRLARQFLIWSCRTSRQASPARGKAAPRLPKYFPAARVCEIFRPIERHVSGP